MDIGGMGWFVLICRWLLSHSRCLGHRHHLGRDTADIQCPVWWQETVHEASMRAPRSPLPPWGLQGSGDKGRGPCQALSWWPGQQHVGRRHRLKLPLLPW